MASTRRVFRRSSGSSQASRLVACAGPLLYLVASICFIQALKGLSSPKTALRGMGKMIYDSILSNDFNLALTGLLFATLVTLLANLAADLVAMAR